MRITAIVAILAICALACPALGVQDSLPPASWQKDSPQHHAETALAELVRGEKEKGFKRLFSKGSYPQRTLEKLQFDYYQTVKKQGDPVGYEKVVEHRVGNSVLRLKYVLLFNSSPMMFDLYYYNSGKDWLLKTFTISQEIKKIFDQ